MKYISILIIFITSICYSFTLYIDDHIWNDDSSDINYHHDIYDIYNEHDPFINETNSKFISLDKREQKESNINYDIKVSIIIPTYNSEDLIRRSIESTLNQTLKEIEILVVDDCSEDSTRSIIDEYKKKDNRIKSFYKNENSGVGTSRNIALNNALGEFIGFVDADDFVDPGWYQYLYENSNNMDIIRGIRVIHDFSETYRKSKLRPYGCIIPSIIRKSFLDKYNIRFPESRKFEDTKFNKVIKSKKPRTNYLPDNGIYYHYVKRENSLSDYKNPNNTTTTTETTETPTQTVVTTIIETIEPTATTNTTSIINERNNKYSINIGEGFTSAKMIIISIVIISLILVIGSRSYFIIRKKNHNKVNSYYEKIEEVNVI